MTHEVTQRKCGGARAHEFREYDEGRGPADPAVAVARYTERDGRRTDEAKPADKQTIARVNLRTRTGRLLMLAPDEVQDLYECLVTVCRERHVDDPPGDLVIHPAYWEPPYEPHWYDPAEGPNAPLCTVQSAGGLAVTFYGEKDATTAGKT